MNERFFIFFLFLQIFSFCSNIDENVFLQISRANSNDKSGSLTPLVVSLSSKDTTKKLKDVDLICVVDVSGSMRGNKISMVKESLNHIVDKIMQGKDRLAIIPFNSAVDDNH